MGCFNAILTLSAEGTVVNRDGKETVTMRGPSAPSASPAQAAQILGRNDKAEVYLLGVRGLRKRRSLSVRALRLRRQFSSASRTPSQTSKSALMFK